MKERRITQSLQQQRFRYTCKASFKDSLQNISGVYIRGIWHDETLTTLEPVKNINSLMKNMQILENNTYSLLTLGYEHKIASRRHLKPRNSKIHEDKNSVCFFSLPKWPLILLDRKNSQIMSERLYERLETPHLLSLHKRSAIFSTNNSFMTSRASFFL